MDHLDAMRMVLFLHVEWDILLEPFEPVIKLNFSWKQDLPILEHKYSVLCMLISVKLLPLGTSYGLANPNVLFQL